MRTSDTDTPVRTLDRVRTILTHRLEERITEREALDELIAEIEAAGYDVVGAAGADAEIDAPVRADSSRH